MFFILSKVLKVLIDPYTFVLFALFLSALFLKGRRWVKICLTVAVLAGYIFSTGWFANTAVVVLENIKEKSVLVGTYDAVIVLSGMIDLKNSSPQQIEFGSSVDRILEGIRLIRSGVAKNLILSGGSDDLFDQSQSEAVYLKNFAEEFGISPKQMMVEKGSRNTVENAVQSAKIIRDKGYKKILLVTSAFHMVRAEGCFVQAGVRVDRWPVDYRGKRGKSYTILDALPSSKNLALVSLVIHEMVGILVYGITGKAAYWGR